jgi:TRAP-type C4-dicarboxylate transport system permease small subunit
MESVLERIYIAFDKGSKFAAYFGGTLLFIAALVITFEVVARKVFNFSIVGADELSGYALGLSMTWGYAYVLFRRAHLRVDAIYNRLPPRMCRWLDVISVLSFLLLIGFLTYRSAQVVHETITMNVKATTPLTTPLWIPQVPWLLGLIFFSLCLLIVFVRCSWALVKSDYALIRRLASASSVSEEIIEDDGTTKEGAKS